MWEKCKELQEELVRMRRELHQIPELGGELPKTRAYVEEKLKELGIPFVENKTDSGLIATIKGEKEGKTIVLRADMDALPIQEANEVDYISRHEGCMHACGHDTHMTMLLGAAKILSEHKDQIPGTVRLLFQTDEEGSRGAQRLCAEGAMDGVDAVFGTHIGTIISKDIKAGTVISVPGCCMASFDKFVIKVKGIGCHGAMPENGVDPINIAAHIHLALQEITAREIAAKTPAVITIGKFSGGQAPNIIPQDAVIEGTIRTFDKSLSAEILQRITVISKATAEAFRGTVTVEELSSAPPLINNPQLTSQMAGFITELFGEKSIYLMDGGGMGSEDFSSFTYELPCVYLLIGAGTAEENPQYGMPMHNEKVIFNEEILAKGAAIHTYCALKWLCDE